MAPAQAVAQIACRVTHRVVADALSVVSDQLIRPPAAAVRIALCAQQRARIQLIFLFPGNIPFPVIRVFVPAVRLAVILPR